MTEMLLKENQALRLHIASVQYQCDAAQTHAIFAQRQCAVLQHQLNSKAKKKTTRRIHTKARVVTSEAGRAEAEAARAEQLAKQKKAEETCQKKDAAAAETMLRRAKQQGTALFGGPLTSKKKEELQDILHALHLPLDGTKAALTTRISEHLDRCPDLAENAQFVGLFVSRSQARKRPQSIEDTDTDVPEPPSQRLRLQDTGNVSDVGM
jgi:hypothetical protein